MMQMLRRWLQGERTSPDFLLAEAQFTGALRSERRRADRSGAQLAMAAFQCSEGTWQSVPNQLSRALHERLRETDVAGLLDKGRVGVVLPNTSADGAWTFVAAILQQCQVELDLMAEVYLYPEPDNFQPSRGTTFDEEKREDDPPHVDRELEPLLADPLPAWKRTLDVVGASLACVLLSPLLLLTAAAVKLTSPGPILFRQWRGGWGGRPFLVYKFRTMCVDAESQQASLLASNEQDGPAFKMKDDPRITSIGRYLRRSCLDELPQFWNVIKGDMTLVGPRPLPCRETDECHGWERRRLEVTPGLTCIWQVDGGTRVSFAEWMRMDIRYINSRRIANDLNLLWRTAAKVILQRASH